MTLTEATWKEVVQRRSLKSKEFKELDLVVSAYIKRQAGVPAVKAKWEAWVNKLERENKTYSRSARYFPGCALDDIARLIGTTVTIVDGRTEGRTVVELLASDSAQNMLKSPLLDFDTPPWIRIGDVFVSFLETGQDSWQYLATQAFRNRDFVILSGRHGNIINPLNPDGSLLVEDEAPLMPPNTPDKDLNVADSAFDRETAALVNARADRAGHRVDVEDIRYYPLYRSSGDKLRQVILQQLAGNKLVVVNWCYSFYSFVVSRQVHLGEDVSDAKKYPAHAAVWREIMATPVKDLANRYWAWVPEASRS